MSTRAMSEEIEMATWRAERAIERVIQSYARGVDGTDFDRVCACFHPDARVQYGDWFSGDREATIAWLERSVSLLHGTLHVFGSPWIVFDAKLSSAECETYAINSAQYPPDESGRIIQNVSGTRYYDHFECREGVWAIVSRRNERVWSRNDPLDEDPPLPTARG